MAQIIINKQKFQTNLKDRIYKNVIISNLVNRTIASCIKAEMSL